MLCVSLASHVKLSGTDPSNSCLPLTDRPRITLHAYIPHAEVAQTCRHLLWFYLLAGRFVQTTGVGRFTSTTPPARHNGILLWRSAPQTHRPSRRRPLRTMQCQLPRCMTHLMRRSRTTSVSPPPLRALAPQALLELRTVFRTSRHRVHLRASSPFSCPPRFTRTVKTAPNFNKWVSLPRGQRCTRATVATH